MLEICVNSSHGKGIEIITKAPLQGSSSSGTDNIFHVGVRAYVRFKHNLQRTLRKTKKPTTTTTTLKRKGPNKLKIIIKHQQQ